MHGYESEVDVPLCALQVSMPLTMRPGSSEIVADPYGVVLVRPALRGCNLCTHY